MNSHSPRARIRAIYSANSRVSFMCRAPRWGIGVCVTARRANAEPARSKSHSPKRAGMRGRAFWLWSEVMLGEPAMRVRR
jgi:hypothetical protein